MRLSRWGSPDAYFSPNANYSESVGRQGLGLLCGGRARALRGVLVAGLGHRNLAGCDALFAFPRACAGNAYSNR